MPTDSANALVVLTQNAWGGAPLWKARRASLARALGQLSPDVVALQEIHAPSRDEGSQAHELAELAGGYTAIFVPGRVSSSGACEGVALLVKQGVEVIDRGVALLSLDRDDRLEGDMQRVVLRATVRRGGAAIDVLATHLSLSRRARERTMTELMAFADEGRRGAGAALMGDFNATPGEPALDRLEAAGWMDAWKHANPEERGGTWPAGAPFRRIDYVWVQPGAGWTIAECRRTPVAGSDHVGLCVRLLPPS